MRKISVKSTGLLFILVAVICGLIAVIITYRTVNSMTKKVPMLIADKKIIAGDPLHKEDFKIVNVPISGRPEDAILPEDKIEGLVALKDMNEKDILRKINTVDLEKNDLPILSTRLRAVYDTLNTIENELSQETTDLRAGEIPIESIIGMLDGMKEGDQIAVTSVYIEDVTQEQKTNKIRRTETIFDYIHVLGIKPPIDNSKGSVVIALSQKQFEALALAREKGKFYIALMPFGVKKPEGHPEILSDLYVQMLENPENVPVIDSEVTFNEKDEN